MYRKRKPESIDKRVIGKEGMGIDMRRWKPRSDKADQNMHRRMPRNEFPEPVAYCRGVSQGFPREIATAAI